MRLRFACIYFPADSIEIIPLRDTTLLSSCFFFPKMISFVTEAFFFMAAICSKVIRSFAETIFPPPRKNISGEIVFLTGAGSGLGRLMALKFAKLGATIACVDINQSANEGVVREIKSLGFNAHGFKCDCSSRQEIYRVAELVKKQVGDVTMLINNAGIVSGKKFLETEDWMIQKTMEVNTMAHFWTTKAFLPSMMVKNYGHVVTIASSAGFFGVPGLCDYCASKFGAAGFDESLNMELGALKKDGINTTVVCPYFMNTGMFEGVKTRFPHLLPILDPEWAAEKIVDAVLRNQRVLFIPKILNFFVFLKGILPTSTYHTMGDFFGINSTMDEFKGRANMSKYLAL
ncbi:epidermal retinol dehydrogenase 2-like isoform X2 [Acropora muricata]|uniref:epidermal retinol dehydrogenase 2-like isoform X2 n=1 Tax=Acropora muricata TaxID=159855 RepID=UPI0034E5C8F4